MYALLGTIDMEESIKEEVLVMNCSYMIESCVRFRKESNKVQYVDTMEMMPEENSEKGLFERKKEK